MSTSTQTKHTPQLTNRKRLIRRIGAPIAFGAAGLTAGSAASPAVPSSATTSASVSSTQQAMFNDASKQTAPELTPQPWEQSTQVINSVRVDIPKVDGIGVVTAGFGNGGAEYDAGDEILVQADFDNGTMLIAANPGVEIPTPAGPRVPPTPLSERVQVIADGPMVKVNLRPTTATDLKGTLTINTADGTVTPSGSLLKSPFVDVQQRLHERTTVLDRNVRKSYEQGDLQLVDYQTSDFRFALTEDSSTAQNALYRGENGAINAQQVDRIDYENETAVKNCGIVTCTVYYTRSATKELWDITSQRESMTEVKRAAGGAIICAGLGGAAGAIGGGPGIAAGAAAGAALCGYDSALSSASFIDHLKAAAEANQCFAVRNAGDPESPQYGLYGTNYLVRSTEGLCRD